ncbi:hypothetical protein JB92DRAFT_1180766 [Gautieria morchelliformis]|nr:hypothetical protein JB92DRAFT_1180766 [Gautieria morchelliformis]
MSVNRQDRDTLKALNSAANGTGSSEVSRKRQVTDSSNPWRLTPSVIHPPSSSRYPGSSRAMNQSAGANPYSQKRYNDLHDKPQRTNPNARTLVSNLPQTNMGILIPVRSEIPSAKKLKLEKSCVTRHHKGPVTKPRRQLSCSPSGSTLSTPPLQGSSSSPSDSLYLSTNGRVPTFKSASSSAHSHSEVIDIDQDEDIGEPVSQASSESMAQASSDDMQIISLHGDSDHNSSGLISIGKILGVDKPHERHAFSESLSKHNGEPLPSAGPHTRALTARVTGLGRGVNGTDKDRFDPIEDAEDFDNLFPETNRSKRRATPATVAVPERIVSKNIFKFESANHPREVDLTRLTKKARIDNMKGKTLRSAPKGSQAYNLGKPPGSARRGQQPQSPDSPSLTRYKTINDNNKDIFIPLEAYVCGSHIVESVNSEDATPRYWLRVRDAHVSILCSPIESNREVVNLELGRDICNVTVSHDQHLHFSPFCQIINVSCPYQLARDHDAMESLPLIAFTVLLTRTTADFFKRTMNFENQQKEVITIKPLTSHANWSLPTFKKVCALMGSEGKTKATGVSFLDAAALRSLWDSRLHPQGNVASDQPQDRNTRRKPQPQPI